MNSGSLSQQYRLMARYNQWMNEHLYAAARTLPDPALAEDRGAFFGSIMGTLNHVMVGDIIWLKRFSAHASAPKSLLCTQRWPAPSALTQIIHKRIEDLTPVRIEMDATIVAFADELTDDSLAMALHYRNTRGLEFCRALGPLVGHFFNHQTHHRGQVTTLLSQAGVDPGVTDLLALVPDSES